MISTILSVIAVGFLWGATNPLIKRGSKGISDIKAESSIKKIFLEIKFLLTTPSYIFPFLLNQCGSILYVITLQEANISMVVPVANSLSFLFTAISGYILKERPSKNILFGSVFIALGSSIIIYEKV